MEMVNGNMNIRIEELLQTPIENQYVEIVERKGMGHPDSLADGLAESVSQALCTEYIKKFGTILHHNTDQVEVVAGRSQPKFGGGELISPIYILLNGRATKDFQGVEIPVDVVAVESAKKYINKVLAPDMNPNGVIIDSKIDCGSTDLQNVFKRGKIPVANDTSFGVGHAPFSELEQIVYNTESMLNNLKLTFPSIGSDIKIMGMRKKDNITLTVACAMIDKYIMNQSEYFSIKDQIAQEIYKYAKTYTDREVEVFVNTGDDEETGSIYLTVTGTSAEMGDDGSVGRGNRCNGLITPNRPMSMEATSGKNPINHVGKLYNLISNEIAKDIAVNIEGIEEVYIRILSQIGKPINKPLIASSQILMKNGYEMSKINKECEEIIEKWLNNIQKIPEMLNQNKLKTF